MLSAPAWFAAPLFADAARSGLGAHLLLLAALYLLAAPAVRAARRVWLEKLRTPPPQPAPGQATPRIAMLVPLTGNAPGMKRCLTSLLHQPGMDCHTLFVVRDEADPAVELVRELLPEHPRAGLVVAGQARTCCQKNHSLLAGLEALCGTHAAGEAPDVLVFCDSTHEAAPDFLARLAAPLVSGRAVLTTAYHRVVPGDAGLATLCHFFAALGIHLLQSLPLLCQPWGGATAILRREFYAHGVDAVWARGVVDDFTMGPYLQSRGVRALAVPEASLITPVAGQTFARWWSWWFRQLLYLKFCMPGTWLAASLGVLALAGLMAWAAADAAAGGASGWLYFAALGAMGVAFGRLSQTRVPAWRLVLGFLAMQLLSVPCFLATWGTNTLGWRGVRYHARLDGTVKRIDWT